MEINYKAIGSRIAARRKALGFKQYEVCEKIGVNDKYLSNLETARSVPSIEVLLKLCEALDTTPDHLLLGKLPPAENSSEGREEAQLLKELEEIVQRYKK